VRTQLRTHSRFRGLHYPGWGSKSCLAICSLPHPTLVCCELLGVQVVHGLLDALMLRFGVTCASVAAPASTGAPAASSSTAPPPGPTYQLVPCDGRCLGSWGCWRKRGVLNEMSDSVTCVWVPAVRRQGSQPPKKSQANCPPFFLRPSLRWRSHRRAACGRHAVAPRQRQSSGNPREHRRHRCRTPGRPVALRRE